MLPITRKFYVATLIAILRVLVVQAQLPVWGIAAESKQQAIRGQNVYLQHCSVCHTAKRLKPKMQPSLGPDLSGLFQAPSANTEPAVRQIILNGGATMPGFRYGLGAADIDDLIAY